MLFVVVFQGLCGWNDTSKGAYDWNRDRGGTPSSNTGPNVDHTLGNQRYFLSVISYLHSQPDCKLFSFDITFMMHRLAALFDISFQITGETG